MAIRPNRSQDDDFIFTLSDDEIAIPVEGAEDTEEEQTASISDSRKRKRATEDATKLTKKLKKAKKQEKEEEVEEESQADNTEKSLDFEPGFEFDIAVGLSIEDDFQVQNGSTGDSVNAEEANFIARVRRRLGRPEEEEEEAAEEAEVALEDGESDFSGFEDDNTADVVPEEQSDAEDEIDVASPVAHPQDLVYASESEAEDEDEREDPEQLKRRAAFFAPEEKDASNDGIKSFLDLNLSRRLMKGLTALGFDKPTPIQRKGIPPALEGKDIVGGAVTGSGKTAAFLVPIIERLVHRPSKIPRTRVAILMPTRELAAQCHKVGVKLAAFTDITFALIVGGLSSKQQEQVLKTRPDIVIATPGRFIDHMRNTPSFAVDELEILVLDEADRMLEDGFASELNEILKTIPRSRQTMLFSATMNENVDELIRAGLRNPVRLVIDARKQTVTGLTQEFVRLRPGREDKRMAYLLYLCKNVYKSKTIIFFSTKKDAHTAWIIMSIFKFSASELHGDMSQDKRSLALEDFHRGKANYLLATDVASRGLDIKGVEAVINYEAPHTHEIYLHRVGRTARAGRTGFACTIAAEPDRKVVKAAIKTGKKQGAKIASRNVPYEDVQSWVEKLEAQKEVLEMAIVVEKEERALEVAERDLKKGENMVIHEDEIKARPKRTWFESEKEKLESKKLQSQPMNDVKVKAAKKKLSNKDKKRAEIKDERNDIRTFKKRSQHHVKSTKPKQKSKGRK
jgi:ATP-dependent RNA helicase DDX27